MGEPEALRKMQELRRRGESYEAIARALDEAGMKPRYASVWNAVVVNRILRMSSRLANVGGKAI